MKKLKKNLSVTNEGFTVLSRFIHQIQENGYFNEFIEDIESNITKQEASDLLCYLQRVVHISYT